MNISFYHESYDTQIDNINKLYLLHELALILNSSHDIDDIIMQSAVNFNEITKSIGCHILFTKQIRDSLKLETAIHAGPKAFPAGADETKGISGMAFNTGEIIIVSDAEHDPRVQKKIQQHFGHKSVLAVPIKVKGKIIGVITVYSLNKDNYSVEDGQFLLMLGTHLGMAVENAKLMRELEMASITDPLTNAYNYRYFHRELKQIAKNFINKQTALIMLDVNDFKLINDTYGHICGDRMLCNLSNIIKANIKESDIVARYAGDEFSVIMPVTCLEKAYENAIRIERALAEQVFEYEGHKIRMTISWGIACAYGQEINRNINHFIDLADRKLYEMKGIKKSGINEKHFYT